MLLRLPHSLHYPIAVEELLKRPEDDVAKFAPLFSYTYTTTVTEDDSLGNEHQVQKSFPARFDSNVEGVLKKWKIEKGMVITRSGLEFVDIEELCAHGVQFGGMCVNCGKDMTESSYITQQVDATRATINMVHDNVSLTVSQDEATKVEDEAKRRLLASKKLSLVVDLDQTIIHATVDPTVAEWQKDENNPNYEAVKDVRAFQLVDDGPGARGCWYYIKLRPGLEEFLDNVSKIYELHIYTMGTRAYAQNIANIIDPQRKIFGDRILSRDESGSLVAKNLQRLFPVDTKMVVIIDDRGDVWKWNDNLIKVPPYDFFVGIGDINSSFLPKKPGLPPSQKAAVTAVPDPTQDLAPGATAKEVEPEADVDEKSRTEVPVSENPNDSTGTNASTLDQLLSMGGGDDPTVLLAQACRQDETLAAQLQDRPLLQKQLQLEAKDAATFESSSSKGGKEGNVNSLVDAQEIEFSRPRHNLLQDHDRELYYLEHSLREVHAAYFNAHARQTAAAQGGRIAELRGSQKRKQPLNDSFDLAMVPDVKDVMPQLKGAVLDGVVIVFSGVVPLGIDIQTSDVALWAKSFGARIENDVGRRTTHVIAARNRTAKVRQAMRRGKGRISVVGTQWLMDSISQWKKVDERPYRMNTDDIDAFGGGGLEEEDEILSESEDVASGIETEDDDASEAAQWSKKNDKPTLSVTTGDAGDSEEDSDLEGLLPDDIEDDQSPVGGTNENWKSMHDELAEFLGSEADDSDGGSVASAESGQSSRSSKSLRNRGKKRSRIESEEDGGIGLSPSRKKQATGRATSLSQSQVADAGDLGLPTPEITAGEEGDKDDEDDDGADGIGRGNDGGGSDDGEGDGWSEVEGEVELEMNKANNEDFGVG